MVKLTLKYSKCRLQYNAIYRGYKQLCNWNLFNYYNYYYIILYYIIVIYNLFNLHNLEMVPN